ncbi:MAG: transporter substrate-binding domain-containing protein, partial [Muribaculaceae bacterium]|nr:transporter substrate-binding domain-containing protein [Muribaculaceae bacterium]
MHKLPIKKKEAWGLLAILLVVGVAMGALRKCSHEQPAPFASHYSPAGGDTLDVAIALVPSIFEVHGDSLAGEHYERLQAIARRHGLNVKYHPFVNLDEALNSLEAGEYDMVVAALPSTAEYQQRFLMTDPIYLDKAVLVQRVDSASTLVTSQLQLAGDTVWVPVGSNYSLSISNLSHEIGDTIY